jgi:hypothetical protein
MSVRLYLLLVLYAPRWLLRLAPQAWRAQQLADLLELSAKTGQTPQAAKCPNAAGARAVGGGGSKFWRRLAERDSSNRANR